MSGTGAPLPHSADVVVVGGGAIGTSVAFHLAEAGVDVLLLEREDLASGSSGKPVGGVRAQFSEPANVALRRAKLLVRVGLARKHRSSQILHQPGSRNLSP